eukprot:GEMP01022570.1.p1 GENE.GEMP01022570.1~~GEMP01022570.1.p1  ORF type:complete len:662 (+),score=108.41 GEMP01022570.1:541-2526(+)
MLRPNPSAHPNVVAAGAAVLVLVLQLTSSIFVSSGWTFELSVVLAIIFGHQRLSAQRPAPKPQRLQPMQVGYKKKLRSILYTEIHRSLAPVATTKDTETKLCVDVRKSDSDEVLPTVNDMKKRGSDSCVPSVPEHQNRMTALLHALRYGDAYAYLLKVSQGNGAKGIVSKGCHLTLAVALARAENIVYGGSKAMDVWELGQMDDHGLKCLIMAAWPRHLPQVAKWLSLLSTDPTKLRKMLIWIQADLKKKCRDLSTAKLFYSYMENPNELIYDMFFRMAGNGGDVSFCWQMLEDMSKNDQPPSKSHVNGLLNALAKTFRPGQAETVYYRYFNSGNLEPNLFTFGTIINSWAKVGDLENAERWLVIMEDVGIKPNDVIYSSVIHACARSGNLPRAEFYAQRMKELGLVNHIVLNTMLKACTAVGNVEKAEYWMQELELSGMAPDEFSYNTMIACCVKAQKLNKVEHWLNKMRSKNITRTEIGYNMLLTERLKVGMYDREQIHEFIQNMQNDGVKPTVSTYNSIIQHFSKSDCVDDAHYWWAQLTATLTPNAISFIIYAKILAQRGDYLAVEKLYYHAQELQERIDESFFSSIFVACGNANPPQRVRAEAWFDEFCKNGINSRINQPLRRSMEFVFGENKRELLYSKKMRQHNGSYTAISRIQ